MQAGRLNRRITILQSGSTRESTFRTDTKGWVPLATVWAEVQDMLPSRGDRLAEGVDIARKPCRVRIRYRTDVTSDMRLRIRSEEYRIVSGPVELGLREALEMLAEQVTPEGVRP